MSRFLIAGAALALLSGCSIFAGKWQVLRIRASDPTARIFVDDREVGIGSASVTVRRDSPHTVVARAGSRGASAFIGLDHSTTAWIDMILGVPTAGITWMLGSTSAGYFVLERDDVRLELPDP
jgi:hypothetical protein